MELTSIDRLCYYHTVYVQTQEKIIRKFDSMYKYIYDQVFFSKQQK